MISVDINYFSLSTGEHNFGSDFEPVIRHTCL